jgi:hypothetical protein
MAEVGFGGGNKWQCGGGFGFFWGFWRRCVIVLSCFYLMGYGCFWWAFHTLLDFLVFGLH